MSLITQVSPTLKLMFLGMFAGFMLRRKEKTLYLEDTHSLRTLHRTGTTSK